MTPRTHETQIRVDPHVPLVHIIRESDAPIAVTLTPYADLEASNVTSPANGVAGEPTTITWEQTEGDLKSVEGSWELEDLGEGRTRATYWMEVDLGRMLGMVIRGPLVGLLRGQLVESMPGKLKRFVEG